MSTAFREWTGSRELASIGTNAGSAVIPFQGWKSFKEAFAPELIQEAIDRSRIDVSRILDPFGGSGTTALAAQFLGVRPTTVEVNPYLADLIAAKLTHYDVRQLRADFESLVDRAARGFDRSPDLAFLPPTFVEPGVKGRYLFSEEVARAIFDLRDASHDLRSRDNARFLRMMLSGVMLDFSNARVSGKGRRYRSNWQNLRFSRSAFFGAYATHVQQALGDLARFNDRPCESFEVLLGDSRSADFGDSRFDLVVFSPPYPNSFDYTDVYNIELWMLGYLSGWGDNRALRLSTLSSHVQVPRTFGPPPEGSPTLVKAHAALCEVRDSLWDARLPEMIEGYFADLAAVIDSCGSVLTHRGQMWMVVGDSQYADVLVPVADILEELAADRGYEIFEKRPFRSMRASPQQGGRHQLAETLLVITKTF